MAKKTTNTLLFALVFAAAAGMTVYVAKGAPSVLIYNFIFLGTMTVIYLIALFGGMFRMDNLGEAFHRAADELTSIFKTPGKTDTKNLAYLDELFDDHYLDKKMGNFSESISQSKEGIGDIEEYINDDELDIHIHKRLLEMVPDIFTSLGILGTFIGLVWGLKNFEPTNYEAMTTSVSSLVDGIKVAFLTSIYGIAFSIIYSWGMKREYSFMSQNLQNFLEKFHAYVMPTAENEARNLLLSSQKMQTKAMAQMAEQFSVQMADSFEKVITPTFQKMNDSLDMLVASVTRCQQDAVRDILQEFLKQMRGSFDTEFAGFNEALASLKQAQKENTAYTTALYQTMSQQLGQSYEKQEKAMRDMVTELGGISSRYMDTASRITQENREIQKIQQQDYQHVVDYMKDAEKSAAKFWVACNQAMQKYVETAASGMEKASASNQAGTDLLASNSRLVEELGRELQEFTRYQQQSYKTMEQVRRLLSELSAVGDRSVYLMSGGSNQESMDRLEKLMEQQAADQQAVLEEISRNIKELSKGAQKGKFGLFK